MNAAVSTVLINAHTGNIEMMHRFYLHDAEHALGQMLGHQVDLLEDPKAQARFARYVDTHFAMGLGEAKAAPVKLIGQGVEGEFIWVYQELAIPRRIPDLWFRFDALQDYWPEQINQVNLQGLGPARSLRFTKDHDWQYLALEPGP